MTRSTLALAVTATLILAWSPALFAAPGASGSAEPEPAPPTPKYLQLDARVLVVPRDFADDLALDPSPIEALLASDATVISVGELTGQVLADAAAMHERGRLLTAGPLLARDGQTLSTLLAPQPTFIALPQPVDAEPLPQVSCVLRGTIEMDEDGRPVGTVQLHGLVLGGIDLALAEPQDAAHGDAEALAVPSVRFAIDLADGEHALLALPFDLTAVFDGPAPKNTIALLLVRAAIVQDGLVQRDAPRDPAPLG